MIAGELDRSVREIERKISVSATAMLKPLSCADALLGDEDESRILSDRTVYLYGHRCPLRLEVHKQCAQCSSIPTKFTGLLILKR